MRLLACAVCLVAPFALAQATDAPRRDGPSGEGRTVRADPTAAEAAATEKSTRLRLVEIDQELRALTDRPTAGSVFLASAQKLTPWFLGASLPLAGLALAFGKFNVTSGPAVEKLIGGGVAILGGLLLIEGLVCFGTVIDHWISEADSQQARNRRLAELNAERDALAPR